MTKPRHSFLYYLLLFIVFYFLVAPLIIYEFNRQNGVVEGFSGVSFTGSFFFFNKNYILIKISIYLNYFFRGIRKSSG